MADATMLKSLQHSDAIERLIKKLILDPGIVGVARTTEKARLINQFWAEHNYFWNKLGHFNHDNIWIAAMDPITPAH